MMFADRAGVGMGVSDKTSLLDMIDASYRRAALCRVRKLVLDNPLVSEIAGRSAHIFSLLDHEDDHQRRLARGVWLLKSTITQTLLPFDDARLGIASMSDALKLQTESVLSAAGAVIALAELVASLLASSINPKREILLQTLSTLAGREGGVAVFAGLQGGLTPGWPIEMSASTEFFTGSCTIFRTRKEIANRGFDTIVIPGTLRFASRAMSMDLLHGGRASEVMILAYKREGVFVPEPIMFPVDHRFISSERSAMEETSASEEEGQQLDQWAKESFWQEVRAHHVLAGPVSERDVTVAARFVLFSDGSGAFLPDDGSVVEVSALVDDPESSLPGGNLLPRKAVRDLEERDLVLLRLSGSGDYLDDVADRLMEREGQPSLREDATCWKMILFRAIKRHGEGLVARTARDEGLKLRSATYLWNWASDAVIAPHDFETFRALIRTLSQLEGTLSDANPDEYALEKWKEMERLKVFHQRAASEIRRLLLDQVRILIAARKRIETVESIQLPGLEAGCIGLLRVSAVDVTSVRIPFSRLFHIVPVKVA
ncbi:MAG: hypothetical protein ACK4HJ_14400 [Acidovorax sp.]